MLSKMSYCPLDEAWNLCNEKNINNENSVPENSVVQLGGYQLQPSQND